MSYSADPSSRFLSREACADVLQRLAQYATGGGTTTAYIESWWSGNLRWARNQTTTTGDVRDLNLIVRRSIRGAYAESEVNQLTDPLMRATVQRAERLRMFEDERLDSQLPKVKLPDEYAKPDIWSDATYNLNADVRATAMRSLVKPSETAGMLSAGYIEVSAHGRSVMDNDGRGLYYPYTLAQYSVTVRDKDGTGSGWAGVDWHDWKRIDSEKLSAIALDKCLRSRNPVRVEPGRYTAILEPQAVSDLMTIAFDPTTILFHPFDRRMAEAEAESTVYSLGGGTSKIGLKIFDERITVSQDCMNPELGFPPFSERGEVYHPINWVEHGVLMQLPHSREYAIQNLGQPNGVPSSRAFYMSGGTTTIDEMIATTKRGLLVTRFSEVRAIDRVSLLATGYTRDGLWLIENGKISKAIYNFKFTESPAFALNNIEQIGVPQRVFRPEAPAVVPPMKVRDFSFTSLSDAV